MIKESLKRLIWRFSSENKFKPNNTDRIALNEVLEYVSNNTKQIEYENMLFAKIYVMCFKIAFTKVNDIVLAQKSMHRILEKDLSYLVEDFTKTLNETELNYFMDSFNNDKDEVINKAKDQFVRHTEGVWDSKDVYKELVTQINLAVNKYK